MGGVLFGEWIRPESTAAAQEPANQARRTLSGPVVADPHKRPDKANKWAGQGAKVCEIWSLVSSPLTLWLDSTGATPGSETNSKEASEAAAPETEGLN